VDVDAGLAGETDPEVLGVAGRDAEGVDGEGFPDAVGGVGLVVVADTVGVADEFVPGVGSGVVVAASAVVEEAVAPDSAAAAVVGRDPPEPHATVPASRRHSPNAEPLIRRMFTCLLGRFPHGRADGAVGAGPPGGETTSSRTAIVEAESPRDSNADRATCS
jgi:hypothetical protein